MICTQEDIDQHEVWSKTISRPQFRDIQEYDDAIARIRKNYHPLVIHLIQIREHLANQPNLTFHQTYEITEE